jgi:hypothetical protein
VVAPHRRGGGQTKTNGGAERRGGGQRLQEARRGRVVGVGGRLGGEGVVVSWGSERLVPS